LRKTALLSLALVLILFFTVCSAVPGLAAVEQSTDIHVLEEILRNVDLLYISEPDNDNLVRGAIEGLLDTLKDPYTVYLSPEELKHFRSLVDGDYVGVGVQLQPGENYPKVVNTIEGAPASAAGIKPGDLVVKVDGIDILKEPLGKVVQKIRGPEGTKVRLTIRREGLSDVDVEMVRANIATPTVNGRIIDGDIGFIRINTFGEPTGDEFKRTLEGLINQGVKKLILDLRDNPGGMIYSAVDISGNFIEPGQVVVSTVDRKGKREEYRAEGNPVGKGMPIVVLVDQNSASASEILAGALQDYGLATLIGGQTYGKGTVQAVIPLEAGGALKITTARYHTPKDRVIDGTGLSPDIQILTPYLSPAVAQRYLNHEPKNVITFETGKSEVIVNGIAVQSGQVIPQQGVSYLPLRLMFEALGYRVDWQPFDGTIKVTGFQTEALFYTGDGRLTIGGQDHPEAAPLLYVDGGTYIPDSVLNLFGINIKQEESKITIEK